MTNFFNKHRIYLLLLLVCFLGAGLRFYKVSVVPPGLYVDEVSIAINSSSIAATGKDEWGTSYPLLFKAYGEYKLPVYIYLTAASIKIFGQSDYAVRLPSVILGTASVALVFFLTLTISESIKVKGHSKKFPLLASLLMAISPWHLQFSRAGFEATVGLFFSILAVLLLLVGLKRRKSPLIFLSFASCLTAMLTYLSTRVFLPPVLLTALLLEWRQGLKIWKGLVISLTVTGLLFFLFKEAFFSVESAIRFQSQSVLTLGADVVGSFTANLEKMFSFGFLFNNGDPNPRHGLLTTGPLFFWQLPLIFAGIFVLGAKSKKALVFLLSWLLFASLPVALGNVSPHALRGLNAVVAWQIICAVGVFVISKNKSVRFIAPIIISLMLLFYLHNYYVHTVSAFGSSWGDGIKKTITEVKKVETSYKMVYLHNRLNYAYYEWYGKSTLYGKNLPFSSTVFAKVRFLDDAYWNDRFNETVLTSLLTKQPGRYLVVVPDTEAKFTGPRFKKVFTVKKTNGEPAFIGYEIESL